MRSGSLLWPKAGMPPRPAAAETATSASSDLTRELIMCVSLSHAAAVLYRDMLLQTLHGEPCQRALLDEDALGKYVIAFGHPTHQAVVLLDQQEAGAFAGEPLHRVGNLVDDHRREPLAGLVQHE